MKREGSSSKNNTLDNKKAKTEHPFFNMQAKKAIQWVKSIDSVLIAKTKGAEVGKSKIAAFDLDGTLINTKSGKMYPKDCNDWIWWDSRVPKKIASLHNEGFKIVVFSNQNGLKSDKQINSFKYKIEQILGQVSDTPIVFFAAMKKDKYRKPMTGMWDMFIQTSNDNVPVDKEASFYVGDAAGRQDGWKHKATKKDHSCADRKFAQNIGIGFYTPEEYFLQEEKADFIWGGFNPKEHLKTPLPLYTPDTTPLTVDDHKELIICVGYPASGKSSFVKKHLVRKDYTYINQDTLKTKEKCVKACQEALSQNQSVVIDNTNPEVATRQLYIKIAKQYNVPVRCFYFGDNEDLAQHNNYYRALYKGAEQKKEVLSILAYRTFKSRLMEPSLKEGFSEVKRINFQFLGDEQDAKAWSQWWV